MIIYLIYLNISCTKVFSQFSNTRKLISHFRVFAYMMVTMFLLLIFGQDSYICVNYPKFVILAYGFTFSQLAAKLLHKSLSKAEEFEQDTLSNNTFFILVSIAILLKELKIVGSNVLDIVLIFGFFLNLIAWLVYLNRITIEMADILGIYRFKMGKKPMKQD
jgi:hypothetical protein